MKTDGQLYTDDLTGPPPTGNIQKSDRKKPIGRDELLILGLILLLTTDRTHSDMPLIIALIYILL